VDRRGLPTASECSGGQLTDAASIAAIGTNSTGGLTLGSARVTATSTSLTYRLVRTSGGNLSDSFTISR
jgi:hypothetical protein